MEIVSPVCSHRPPVTLEQFVQRLRGYKKESIVNIVPQQIWHIFLESNSYKEEERNLYLNYGPRVLLLAFACTNNHRDKNFTLEEFEISCGDYLSIGDSDRQNNSLNSSFLGKEAEEIAVALRNTSIPKHYIDCKYINTELLWLSRLHTSQSTHQLGGDCFVLALKIFKALDQKTQGKATEIIKKILNIEPLEFLRSAFALFSLACKNDGSLNFKQMIEDPNFCNKLNINLETCRLVASKLSLEEKHLFQEWYEKEVKPLPPQQYQKFFPNPLLTKPVIQRNSNQEFLIPSPVIYLQRASNYIFDALFKYDENSTDKTGFSAKLGEVLEEHIRECLQAIIGSERVIKITADEGQEIQKTADLYITLELCDLIIEVKKDIGGDKSRSLMRPEDVAKIWERLYEACLQCAASLSVYDKKSGKPVIPIVLIASQYMSEAITFQKFALETKIFKDLHLRHVEFISWEELETQLSQTSVTNFAKALLARYQNDQASIFMSPLACEPGEPAHQYEYLKSYKNELGW